MKWKYELERLDLAVEQGGFKGVEAKLNERGADEWEYVGVQTIGGQGIQARDYIIFRKRTE